MEAQKIKEQVKGVFSPAHLKKAAALAVLVGVATAGTAYFHYQQVEAHSLMKRQARSEMIAAQAAQRNIILLDEDKVRSIAADSIGKSEAELTFRPLELKLNDHDGDRDHNRKGHKKGKHGDREQREQQAQPAPTAAPQDAAAPAAAPQDAAAPAAPADPAAQADFRPFYKVKCTANNITYKLRIDAVTGALLASDADTDDHIF